MSASALAEESTLIKTPPKRISPAWLFVVVIGFPVLAIVACFPLLSSSFFQKYGDLPNERRLGVVFQARDQKCDILLYGDSTAQVGLDPELITKATHLTTCNIAVTEPAIELLGTEPLDRFLSVNPRPHYLVFSFSASNLSPPDSRHSLSLDGVVLTLRYLGWLRAMRSMITNPDRILGVLSYTYLAGSRQVVENILHRHSLPVALNKIATGEGTHFVMPLSPLTECQLFVGSRVPPDQKWISSLRAQFRSRADNVIVNVSPSSSCIDVYPAWATLLAQGTDNGLQEYPLDLFADSYYHLNGAGAKRYSEAVAKEIMGNTESSTTAALQAVSDWREQSTAQR